VRAPSSRWSLLVAGVVLGVAYGLVTRIAFGAAAMLSSVTYVFLTPVLLGAIPLLIVSEPTLRAYRSLIFLPWLTLGGLFLAFAALRIEGAMCLVVLAAPFLVTSLLGAFIVRAIRLRREARRTMLSAFVVVPILLAPLEQAVRSPSRVFAITSEVTVRAPASLIWEQIVQVPEIEDREYTSGTFNSMGIPRPLEAKLFGSGVGARREGHFDGGLVLGEEITEWDPSRRVAFSITVRPETIRPVAFDQHVLTGGYFEFIDAAYDLEPLDAVVTRLRLTSRYRLTSKLNFYGRVWGDAILRDFQERLLAVLAARSERIRIVEMTKEALRKSAGSKWGG
jgi:hypothetical protein